MLSWSSSGLHIYEYLWRSFTQKFPNFDCTKDETIPPTVYCREGRFLVVLRALLDYRKQEYHLQVRNIRRYREAPFPKYTTLLSSGLHFIFHHLLASWLRSICKFFMHSSRAEYWLISGDIKDANKVVTYRMLTLKLHAIHLSVSDRN